MKTNRKLLVAAALMATLVAGTADAGKGGKKGGGGGGGVPTNYGCQYFSAGKVFTSPDGITTKKLLIQTYTCYLCDFSTNICTAQSPASLAGWTFPYNW